MKYPKVTIGVILYSGEKYLPYSIPSLLQLKYPGDIEILFLDYGPEYSAENFLRKTLSSQQLGSCQFLKSKNKLFHSGGHNLMMEKMTGSYYVCASNDMLYASDFLKNVIDAFIHAPEYGVAGVKILSWDFLRHKKLPIIDSMGIGVTRGQYFFDIGQGLPDTSLFQENKEIFGPSGALSVFHVSALQSIVWKDSGKRNEYFDEFLHYKDDIDMAYRLKWAGVRTLLVANAHVWHNRQVGVKEKSQWHVGTLVINRKQKTKWVRKNSFFGHLVVLYKNVFGHSFSFRLKLRISLSLFFRFFYILFREPTLLYQVVVFLKKYPSLKSKKQSMSVHISARDIQSFFHL